MIEKRKPKRFSKIPETEYQSGSLWMFQKHLRKSLQRLVAIASDQAKAEKIGNDLLDGFDRVAGELNGSIVQDIDRRTKLYFNNAEKSLEKLRFDDDVRTLRDELLESGTKKHKIVSEIMLKTGFRESKVRRALKKK